MNPDPFILASGIVAVPELDVAASEALYVFAENFLRSGGIVSLTEYAQLSSSSRHALSHAGLQIAHERAQIIAGAILGNLDEVAEEAASGGAKAAAEILVGAVRGDS